MKVAELFEITNISYNDDYLLLEYLGNLEVVDKKFLGMLKTLPKYEYNRHSKMGLSLTGWSTDKLVKNLGQKSKVETIEAKSAADAHRAIKEDPKARAVTMNANGNQVFVAIKVPKDNNPDIASYQYIWSGDYDYLMPDLDRHTEQQASEIKDLLTKGNIEDYSHGKKFSYGNEGELYKAMGAVVKVLKIDGIKNYTANIIYIDEERLQVGPVRANSKRYNSHPDTENDMPGKNLPYQPPRTGDWKDTNREYWEYLFKAKLKARLGMFKTINAKKRLPLKNF